MPRSGYKHPQVLHKCALLSPVPLLSGRHTNSADALRLRNLPPLAMRRLAAPMKAVAGYLAWLSLAWLGSTCSLGVALLLLALRSSRTRFSRVFARALHKRGSPPWRATTSRKHCVEFYDYFFNVKMRKLHFLLSVLLAIVSAEEGEEEECVKFLLCSLVSKRFAAASGGGDSGWWLWTRSGADTEADTATQWQETLL